jgi:membrane-anchored protein YejM (alkaline phosphatase superfamily)
VKFQIQTISPLLLCGLGFVLACSAGPTTDKVPNETGNKDGADSAEETGEDSGTHTEKSPLFLEAAPKNLLFIAFDTTRLDRIQPEIAPRISAMLEETVFFPEHRACSNWTYLSFGCALTGLSNVAQEWVPRDLGDLGSQGSEIPYPEAPEMMAERFADGGFSTVLTGSHPFLSAEYNLFQGYQEREVMTPRRAGSVGMQAAELAQERVASGEPWMMHVHFEDPHIPYKTQSDYIPEYDDLPQMGVDFTARDLISMMTALWPVLNAAKREDLLENLNAYYNGEVRYMDEQFGVLMDALQASGALEDTLVVLYTDHGEQFFEHGEFAHGATLHGEETRALLAFWHEDLPPRSLDWKTANEDILPTLLDLFSLPVVNDSPGLVLSQLTEAPTRPVFAVHTGGETGIHQSVRLGDDYLIYYWQGHAQRYQLADDPTEAEDLYGQDAELEQGLMALLEPRIEALALLYPQDTPIPLD